jgi:hypothetical protein
MRDGKILGQGREHYALWLRNSVWTWFIFFAANSVVRYGWHLPNRRFVLLQLCLLPLCLLVLFALRLFLKAGHSESKSS